jgi:hypothetical protein
MKNAAAPARPSANRNANVDPHGRNFGSVRFPFPTGETVNRFVPLLACAPFFVGCGETTRNDPPIPAVAPVEAGERVENPAYRSWVAFPIGTVVERTSVTEEIGRPEKTTTTIAYTLIAKTDETVTLELKTRTTRYDGLEMDNPPDRFSTDRYYHLPVGQKPAQPESAKELNEPMTVGAKSYRVRLVESRDRNEGGEVFVKTWTSDAIPGGLVKSITETPGVKKRTTIETASVTVPK